MLTTMIPYGKQEITEEDIEAVGNILRSDFLTQGPCVSRFESSVSEYAGSIHAVACNSATSALHLACLALGLGIGDRLWTSPITFVASANCARYCGADVDFVDIDPRTYNMCPQALEAKLIEAERDGSLPKVVVPVHMCGQSCDMKAIHALGQRFGFSIIEDASHALGGRYQNEPVGSGRYSDITVFSFHPVKMITTGEGGMALTNSAPYAERMRCLRSHGIVRSPERMEQEGGWFYEQIDLGFNHRMTDIQAALGISQMKRLDAYVQRRRELVQRYGDNLKKFPLVAPWQNPNGSSSWHLYIVRLNLDEIQKTRKQVFKELKDKGIGVQVHYIPVYYQPYYRELGFSLGCCPQADSYYEEAITLPLFPKMTESEQDRVIEILEEVLC